MKRRLMDLWSEYEYGGHHRLVGQGPSDFFGRVEGYSET